MPKDAKKNVDRYKIRGGELNEFEFHKNQASVKEPQNQASVKQSLPGNRNAAKSVKGAAAKSVKRAANKSSEKKAAKKTRG